MWIDPLGLSQIIPIGMVIAAELGRFGTKVLLKAKNIELVNFLKESSALDAIVYCVGD